MEDESALSFRKEEGDPVDHVGWYIFGKEDGPKPSGIDVVKASFHLEEEGGDFQKGSLEGFYLVGEDGYRIQGAEAGEGATLVGVEQAILSCEGGESDCEDALEDLRDSFEEDYYPEGGWCVVGWLSRFVQDDPISVFEGGQVVPEGHKWGQVAEEEVWVDGVYLFPNRVWDPVRARCRGGGALGESARDLLFGEGDG